MAPRRSLPDIEVHLPFNVSLTRGVLEGVNRFRLERPDLLVEFAGTGDLPPVRHCHGLIVFGDGILKNRLGKEVKATVNLSNRNDPPPTHSVLNDDYAVGRMAADHFIEQGFRNFAFLQLGEFHFFDAALRGVSRSYPRAFPGALERDPEP